jgi:hypothetical protein
LKVTDVACSLRQGGRDGGENVYHCAQMDALAEIPAIVFAMQNLAGNFAARRRGHIL